MVQVQKSVLGYSQSGAVARAPDSMKLAVNNHVQGLEKLGVTPGKGFLSKESGEKLLELRGDLKQLLGKEKADKSLKLLSMSSLSTDLHLNLTYNLRHADPSEVKHFKECVHFSHGEKKSSGLDSGERMMVRTAMMLAFAQGASSGQLTELRNQMISGDSTLRERILGGLNTENADPTQVLANAKGEDENATVTGMLDWASQQSTGVDHTFPIKMKVSEFFQKHPDKISLGREGAVAVSIYTGAAYSQINTEMRNGKLSAPVKEIVETATSFLQKLPDFEGIVCRGVEASKVPAHVLAQYKVGATISDTAFTSSSADRGFGGSIQFIIQSKHGKEVTDMSILGNTGDDGREIVFLPGAKFEVLAVETSNEDHMMKFDPYSKTMKTEMNKNGEKTMFVIMKEVD